MQETTIVRVLMHIRPHRASALSRKMNRVLLVGDPDSSGLSAAFGKEKMGIGYLGIASILNLDPIVLECCVLVIFIQC